MFNFFSMKVKKTVLIVVALFVGGTLHAQDIELATASVQMEFPFPGGDQVITRNYKNTHFVTHFRNQNDSSTHCFTICKKPGGPVLRFSTDFPDEIPSRTSFCNVNDMQIFGDYCYFCGRMRSVEYDMVTGMPIIESTQGFWGYFSVADALLQNVTIRYNKVDNTYELYQMAVGQNAATGDVVVSTVGVCDDRTTACVAELVQAGSSWSQSVAVINNVSDIVFADIVNVGGKFYMASYNRCSDGDASDVRHWTFNVHSSSNWGFGADYASVASVETAAQHNVQSLFGSPHTGWHTGDMTIKLCALAGWRFCLAYNGRDSDGTEGVVMLSLSNEFQVDTVLAFTDGVGSKLLDMVRIPKNNVVAALTRSQGTPDGTVYYPTLGDPTYGVPYLRCSGVRVQSLDRRNLTNIVMGGYQTTSFKKITEMTQHVDYVYPNFENSCFETDHVTYYPKDDYYPEIKYLCEWGYRQAVKPVSWREQERGVNYFDVSITCRKLLNGIILDSEENDETE